ncbi:TetR/AcrR family transcriptional regulator [Shewanella sp. KX20019]|uniref:TetR/AcrR family transcriptional regulator n=1 Tax=Shewanella sp. KX20019 TaxID=2803864 RepID=UPI00192634F7|nr:TetR/AcrR family transcriptional regulator [Shewanella sp. KX20019]QQX79846.1 TetR/AcrR family transcriptional regulator [Shewanella sp. KX20019]
MQCPNTHADAIRCNQLLDIAESLVDTQGVVSFRFSQISKGAGCSTNTLYKYFESKEDVLVCLFLRNTTSSQIPLFLKENPSITINDKSLLAIIFTFEIVKRSPIFNILRLVSINSMFWQLASPEKISILKSRVNLFWSRIKQPLEDAVELGELKATDTDISDLSQAIYFFLAGATSSYQSRLMEEEYFVADDTTWFRHVSRIMNRYQWRKPITQEQMQDLSLRVKGFLERTEGKIGTCDTCLAIGKLSHCKGKARS